MADADLAGSEIGEKGGNGERRQAANAALVGGANRLDPGRKTADPPRDECRRAIRLMGIGGMPSRLDDRLSRRKQGEEDETVHLAMVLGGRCLFGIKSALRILFLRRHE